MTPPTPAPEELAAHRPPDGIHVYRVGWCQKLWRARRMLSAGLPPRTALEPVRQEWGFMLRCARQRDWRAVKNCFNGWLAEPTEFPPGLTRCGSGWTENRARRDLSRRARKVGAS